MRPRKRRRIPQNNGVLSKLYSRPGTTLYSLHDLALRLYASSPTPPGSPLVLVREGDSPEYVSLIRQAKAALPPSAPPIEGSVTLEKRWTLQQVIERVIQLQFRQERNGSSVLCFGFQQPRPRSAMEIGRTGPTGLDYAFDNTAVALLNLQPWKTFHSRVGDRLMLYLLMYAEIFHPLPNACFVQISGNSVLAFALNPNKVSCFAGQQNHLEVTTADGIFDTKHVFESTGVLDDEQNRELKDACTEVTSNMKMSMNMCNKTKKRKRPFSWQRHKAQKLCSKLGELEMYNKDASSVKEWNSFGVTNTAVIHKSTENMPVTQTNDSIQYEVHESSSAEFHTFKVSMLPVDHRNHSAAGQPPVLEDSLQTLEQAHGTQQEPCMQVRTARTSCTSKEEFHKTSTTVPAPHKLSSKASKVDARESSPQKILADGCHGSYKMSNRLINRRRIFYRTQFSRHAGFPKNHILQRLKPVDSDSAFLHKAIFNNQRSLHCTEKCSNCVCRLLKRLILNAKRCQFTRLLKRHCPCSDEELSMAMPIGGPMKKSKLHVPDNSMKTSELKIRSEMSSNCTTWMQDEPISKEEKKKGSKAGHDKAGDRIGYSSHSQVVAFIWSACRRIVPVELLGTRRNWRALRKNIHSFVSLRRNEHFSLYQCMHNLQLSGYSWCQEKELSCCGSGVKVIKVLRNSLQDGTEQKEGCWNMPSSKVTHAKEEISFDILERWIYWFFTNLVVPLIECHFYVSESENQRQDVLYFRKPVWAKMKADAMRHIIESNFQKLGTSSAVCLLKQGTLGFSQVRLLKKKTGMRLIANLGCSSSLPCRKLIQDNKRTKCSETEIGTAKEGNHNSSRRWMKPCFRKGTVNSGRVVDNCITRFKPINKALRDLHYCLKLEQESHSEDLGCSVFDYNDIYMKLLPFITDFKRNPKAVPHLVVCDVSRAFDTIKQDKLMDVLQNFIHGREYLVKRYSYVAVTAKSLKVIHERFATAMNSTVPDHRNEDTNLKKFLSHLSEKRINTVCIDQAYATRLKRDDIIKLLEEHITRNILQIGPHFYLQVVGIPQGSILSSLLCSLYFGHLEKHWLLSNFGMHHVVEARRTFGNDTYSTNQSHAASLTQLTVSYGTNNNSRWMHSFQGSGTEELASDVTSIQIPKDYALLINASKPKNILLRLVDDWLFISSSQEKASEFATRMHRGFVDYNSVANKSKTALSFNANVCGSFKRMNVYRTEDGACYMRWSGLLINCSTLEIQADYTRYCGLDICSTLTVHRENRQKSYLVTKLSHFVRPKCHPVFYDLNINSPATTFLNAYQAFLLCAMKFHAYNRSLCSNGSTDPHFCLKSIQRTARYMHSLLAHRANKLWRTSQVEPLLSMHVNQMEWLALCAFYKVLLRKQSRYAKLICLIKIELQSQRYCGLSTSPILISAMDDLRSSMFKHIIY